MLPLVLALLAAAPPASLELRPARAKPGDAVLLIVTGSPGEPGATVEGRPVRFWRTAEGWRGIAGLPVEQPTGPLVVTASAAGAPLEGTVVVLDPAFPSRELTVPPKFVEPPPSLRARIAADQHAFTAAMSRPFAPPRGEAAFAWPILSETTGRYGDRRTYNGRQQSQHYGLDLDAATGTPVLAANDGVVVMARDNYYAGRTVLLWHGADVYSAYFHLSRLDVKVGRTVRRGERVGLSGASGRATGPHLHWGIKVGGRWVDPESVLRLGAFAR
ncbi:MAG TPA: M23 family metallopeptidase [Anaeromyxobacteraceae bacterium]|nr:M23 family metallopeptidase [Anaeromyxobacteraceae bacterium]